ncbi:uncharacterized protein F5891DRAFT_43731 [Suillus fuscotomentosus]|uniref:Secreted protein n=1 Tax=Suillus fuscotomentosus TaxID=1912939 RepID=A0AAD4EE53_9AGAM|nr:uncharacterized protein F5891DRAFT_43731 [Suillus fuscotomentosus]KAG1904396.1 hypothetical protein F5891DRAFT_43731 [Suillus fuscotomentosus]
MSSRSLKQVLLITLILKEVDGNGVWCSVSKIIPCSVFTQAQGRSRRHRASSRSLFFMPQQNPLLNHPEAIILDKDSHQSLLLMRNTKCLCV